MVVDPFPFLALFLPSARWQIIQPRRARGEDRGDRRRVDVRAARQEAVANGGPGRAVAIRTVAGGRNGDSFSKKVSQDKSRDYKLALLRAARSTGQPVFDERVADRGLPLRATPRIP